jgi:BlaI family transcriptional regulator, penicillinase repressor
MDIVFSLEEATLTEILARVVNPPSRPALRSIIGILEDKGMLKHAKKRGREFVYRATESRQSAGRSALGRVVETFFTGSIGKAVATHLNDPSVQYSEEELADLAKLIEEKRTKTQS